MTVDVLLARIGPYQIALRAEHVVEIVDEPHTDAEAIDLPALFECDSEVEPRLIYMNDGNIPLLVRGELRLQHLTAATVESVPGFLSSIAERAAIDKLLVMDRGGVAFVIDPVRLRDRQDPLRQQNTAAQSVPLCAKESL